MWLPRERTPKVEVTASTPHPKVRNASALNQPLGCLHYAEYNIIHTIEVDTLND